MKVVCISPDDLSALIFCKTLSRLLGERKGTELVTIGGQVEGLDSNLYAKEVQRDLRSKHFGIPMKRFVSPWHDFIYFIRIYKLLKRERCDVVITFTTKPNIWGQFAAILAGVPKRIIAVRGLGRVFSSSSTRKDHVLLRTMKFLYRLSCARADRVWFTNESDMNYLKSAGIVVESQVFMTRNAVDLSDFSNDAIDDASVLELRQSLRLSPSDKVVVMVARLIEQKGIKEFAEAAVMLRDRVPNLHFLLVAPEEPDNPSRVPLSYIHHIEANANFQWLGFRKDVRVLYALADLSVLPSYYKEGGYPRALLEAMAYGKPVIAADTNECRGPVDDGKNGYLVPPKNAEALADAIYKIATNSELAHIMGQHSLEKMKAEFDDRVILGMLINEVIFPPSKHCNAFIV